MNELIQFNFESSPIRVTDQDGEAWFVAKDVCKALDINWTSYTLRSIKDEWKGVLKISTPGGPQDVMIVSQGAAWKLAFRSKTKQAEAFTDWIAGELLPALEKYGSYQIQKSPEEQAVILAKAVLEQQALIDIMAPKAAYVDKLLSSESSFPVTIIAKQLDTTAIMLNRFLAEKGIIFSCNRTWVLKSRYQGKGLDYIRVHTQDFERDGITVVKTFNNINYTERGRKFIINLWHEEHTTLGLEA